MPHRRGWRGRHYYASQPGGKGTPVNPTLATGYYENLRPRVLGGVEGLRSAGTRSIVELVEGMTGVELSADIPQLQGSDEQEAFLNLGIAAPVNSELTYLTIGYGYEVTGEHKQIEDCKIDTLSFNLDNTGQFSGSYTAMGGKVATPAPVLAAQTYLTEDSFQAHEAVYSEFELASYRAEYRNNLVMQPVIAGPLTTRDPARVWDYLTEGPVDVTGTIGLYNTSGKDLQAACISPVTSTLTFTNKCSPANVGVLTVTGYKPTDDTLTIPGADGDVEWEIPWIGTGLTWAVTEY